MDLMNSLAQAGGIDAISRELGVDPKTGKTVYAKLGKFGAYAQIGENPDDNGGEKPKFASLRPGQFIENLTLGDAMELFKMPRDLGFFVGERAETTRNRPRVRAHGLSTLPAPARFRASVATAWQQVSDFRSCGLRRGRRGCRTF